MKPNITKIIAAIFCSVVFASTIHAQSKLPRPIQFGEITESDEKNFQTVSVKVQSFLKRLAEEPTTVTGYIDVPDNIEIGAKIKSLVDENSSLKSRVLLWGKLKHPERYHFLGAGLYLVPQGAEIPASCILESIYCPTLTVKGEESFSPQTSSALVFTANVQGGEVDAVITYNWKISAGRILEGQSTPTIKVDAVGAKEITATVEIGGVGEECPRETLFTSKIEVNLEMIDSFGREPDEQIQARLDVFLTPLINNPTARGYIINYGSRANDRRDFLRRNKTINNYLTFRHADTSRITFIDGGYRENVETELWISTDDNLKPVPTPTIDEKPVKTTSAAKKSARRKSK